MAMMCYKTKGSCKNCVHYKMDEDEGHKMCFVSLDTKLLVGKKIEIINMNQEPQYTGCPGVVEYIDSAGQIHGTWGGCALIPTLDEFILLNDKEKK